MFHSKIRLSIKKYITFGTIIILDESLSNDVGIIYLKESFYCKKQGKEMQKREYLPRTVPLQPHAHSIFKCYSSDCHIKKIYLS